MQPRDVRNACTQWILFIASTFIRDNLMIYIFRSICQGWAVGSSLEPKSEGWELGFRTREQLGRTRERAKEARSNSRPETQYTHTYTGMHR